MSRYPGVPIHLYVRDRNVVVIGSRESAQHRCDTFTQAGARVTLCPVEDVDSDAFNTLISQAFLVMSQTGDKAQDGSLAERLQGRAPLVYGHDSPDHSNFAVPAISRHGFLSLAISTDGEAPALAGRLRAELDRILRASGAILSDFLEQMRELRKNTASEARATVLQQHATRLSLQGTLAIRDDSHAASLPLSQTTPQQSAKKV